MPIHRDPDRSAVLNRCRSRQAAACAPPRLWRKSGLPENRLETSRANLTEKPMRGSVAHRPAYPDTGPKRHSRMLGGMVDDFTYSESYNSITDLPRVAGGERQSGTGERPRHETAREMQAGRPTLISRRIGIREKPDGPRNKREIGFVPLPAFAFNCGIAGGPGISPKNWVRSLYQRLLSVAASWGIGISREIGFVPSTSARLQLRQAGVGISREIGFLRK
jgi:hypothetical protein